MNINTRLSSNKHRLCEQIGKKMYKICYSIKGSESLAKCFYIKDGYQFDIIDMKAKIIKI